MTQARTPSPTELLYQREADLAVEIRRQLEPKLAKLYAAVRKLSS